MIIANNK